MAPRFAALLLAIGTTLLAANVAGLFLFTEIEKGADFVLDSRPRTLSAKEFWKGAERLPGESTDFYVRRLTDLISDRFLLADPRHAKPTFFENWLLWARARSLGRYEWTDTRRAVRLGGGYCSQHAMVLDNILQDQGIEARILTLNGHVVNEARIDGQWRVCDPDHGIVFDHSLDELEGAPETVYRVYRAWGHSHEEAAGWREIYASRDDNDRLEGSVDYDPLNARYERVALCLVWVVPIVLILLGGLLRRIGGLLRPPGTRKESGP